MKCNHCHTDFFAEQFESVIGFSQKPTLSKGLGQSSAFNVTARTTTCPACRGGHISLQFTGNHGVNLAGWFQVYPNGGAVQNPPPETPAVIAQDFKEANSVLNLSPKASAALARRCLQAVLASSGYHDRNLVRQIDAALAEVDASKAMPSAIRENLDAIRIFGNFSAHPLTDQTTLQIIDVEFGEAEWCLELLLDLFDHLYVKPARAAERRTALASKLASAGKPAMQSA